MLYNGCYIGLGKGLAGKFGIEGFNMEPIIIVGTGLAGYTLARELRKLDKAVPLTIVTRDDGAFYSKPMLSNALASGKTADALASQSSTQMAEQLAATILAAGEVGAIDPAQHTIQVGARTLAYSKLVLAVGADPLRPPLAGDGAADVQSINDLTDYRRFRARLSTAKRVAIIGAGLIGCELANDLRLGGFEVTVVGRGAYPLDNLIPAPAGHALQHALTAIGIQFEFGSTVEKVDRTQTGYTLTTDQGKAIECDIVLSAIGLRPRLNLAQTCGLKTQTGIVVDRYLRSSDADIFALGDCAQVDGLVLPFVLPLMNAARALAKTLAGTPTSVVYPAMPVVVKTPAHSIVVASPPRGQVAQWACEVFENGVRCLCRDQEGKLVGFVLTGSVTSERQTLAKELPAVLA